MRHRSYRKKKAGAEPEGDQFAHPRIIFHRGEPSRKLADQAKNDRRKSISNMCAKRCTSGVQELPMNELQIYLMRLKCDMHYINNDK